MLSQDGYEQYEDDYGGLIDAADMSRSELLETSQNALASFAGEPACDNCNHHLLAVMVIRVLLVPRWTLLT